MSLARPSSATSGDFITGTEFNSAGTLFSMAVVKSRVRSYTRVGDVTADGSATPVYKTSGYLYMNFVLEGWMANDTKLGIVNLDSTTNNPVSAMVLNYSSGRTHTFTKALLSRIRIRYDYRAPSLGVMIQGVATTTLPAAVEV